MAATLRAITIVDDILKSLEKSTQPLRSPSALSGRAQPTSRANDNVEAQYSAVKAPEASKKASKKTSKTSAGAKPTPTAEVDVFAQADLRVARIRDVEAVPGSDKLWKCRADIGEPEARYVVAGLQQHVPREQLEGLLAVVVCNLKPAKLAGHLSEAMILAAKCEAAGGSDACIWMLKPPEGACPGDKVTCAAAARDEAPAKTMKTKAWQAIQGELVTKGGRPVYKAHQLCTAGGPCTMHGVPDGLEIR